jgi:hypothetical protein
VTITSVESEATTRIYVINPLLDRRWDDLIARHPRASVFHEPGWIAALTRTYGYTPFALTSSPPGYQLTNGVAFCLVSSWVTGTRVVSLPFADHCEPLLSDLSELSEFTKWLRTECDRRKWKYFELRPLSWSEAAGANLVHSQSCWLHTLRLEGTVEELFGRLHKDSIQRKIRRAEREGLVLKMGSSEELVTEFYRLMVMTRRRHYLPPQPRAWFRNLVESMGDKAQIRVARKNNVAIAAILTLRRGSSMVYKYGGSDKRFHNLGGMPFLFWRLIEECKSSGLAEIDFGRSDLDNPGLITFKDRFGTAKQLLTYYRYSQLVHKERWTYRHAQSVRRVLCALPTFALSVTGRILYRHLG